MIRAIRARKMKSMLMYYAALTAFFIGTAVITSHNLHHRKCMSVPESVAGKGIDEVVDEEEAEITQDTERFAKVPHSTSPEDDDIDI